MKTPGSQVDSPVEEGEGEEVGIGVGEDRERRRMRSKSTAVPTASKVPSRWRAGVAIDEGSRISGGNRLCF